MSNHEEEGAESAERGTRTIPVKLGEGTIEEIQLCLRFSAPEGTSEGLLKTANEDMQRLSLKEANKGSFKSGGLYNDTDENVSMTIQGLNRPSFQPTRRLGDGLEFECSGKLASQYQRFAFNSYENEGDCDEYITQIAAEELEEDDVEEPEIVSGSTVSLGGADDFENIDEESAAEDEDVGDARMPRLQG
ncbi:uncharacterized protein TrAFT101_002008 [Trichoderma asperellum]|uniref:Uncharacterized protein n=1 Tax=Trichoderma asperellum (strain ATCC 204424 / CBS 433.97 / NBRC 101777) TaxID=1042311 RepID=A0A2T3ZF84_TRIA4|nr:hypothetical protein M441DRAFT_372822 [Trichoderma asperellum CBS 433.97]PTB43449.1 hypothetical protein M441DRAFT_372822 [Trichoderma asperellum CBS 433.97]UKZ86170.1 hypothetical protein TrAFT101_002008 [Trichoderma asperellum]